MYNNSITDQLLPLITPEMLTRYPDQTCAILNRMARLVQQASTSTGTGGGQGNLEDIIQTTTSYDDGGVNIVTAYLSDGTTQDFQIRNGHQGSQGDDGPAGPANTLSIGTVVSGATADATITGTSPNQTLNLTLPKGDAGTPGPANTLSIGTVTSGATADATITGTSPNQTLNLVLPKGDQGDPGTAATISVGNTTTLPAGSSATVTNTGTSTAAVFDFGIPEGDKGDTGDPGADGFSPIATVTKSGDTATISITDQGGTTTATVSDGADGAAATIAVGSTSTLPAGSSATVTNSGTSSAAVFDFGIPKGDTGAAGADGADGFSPIATVTKSGDTATISITDENGTTTATVTDGTDGAAGPANTLSIGTVTSGATADATITGTSPNQTLNLVLPKGDPADPPEAIGTADGNPITLTDAGPSIKNINHFYGDTSQQQYTGKNILNLFASDRTVGTTVPTNGVDFTFNADGTITVHGTSVGGSNFTFLTTSTILGTGHKYVGEIIEGTTTGIALICYDNSWNGGRNVTATGVGTFETSEMGAVNYNRFRVRVPDGESATNVKIRLMVVDNSLADVSYEPYTNGPAPNPDYPQAINVVTGTQTVTISDGNLQSSTYNLRLGSLELCKLQLNASTTVKDYIYKSGSDWYVHKETAKVTYSDSTGWSRNAQLTTVNRFRLSVGDTYRNATSVGAMYCNQLRVEDTYSGDYEHIYKYGTYLYAFFNNSRVADATALNTYLANNPLICYFPLTTATDTQITDADLIADLNALNTASLYEDDSVITVTAVSPNLAGTLDIDYWTEFKGEPGSGGGTVNDGVLTIQKNGTNVTTFSANQATNATANITVPTQFSDLSGTISTSQIANNAVTATQIDWTTMAEITESGTNPAAGGAGNYQMCIRYPNGIQIISGYYSDDAVLYKNNYADKTVTFAKSFSALPNVVVGLQSDSTSPDMGNITVSTCTTSTTQFTARCFYYNAGSAGRRPAIRWTAIGHWS